MFVRHGRQQLAMVRRRDGDWRGDKHPRNDAGDVLIIFYSVAAAYFEATTSQSLSPHQRTMLMTDNPKQLGKPPSAAALGDRAKATVRRHTKADSRRSESKNNSDGIRLRQH